MQNKNIVIGIGNLLFCDDGIGVIAINYLRKNYEFKQKLELLDGGTLGFNLAEYFLNYDNVFIVDTISIDDKAGEIYKIPSDELLNSSRYKNTAHEVEVVEMLEICELHGKRANITLFGIIPQDINSIGIGLSEVLHRKFDLLIQTLLKEVEILGIEVVKKDNVLLAEIIDELRL
ncbi:HyaD/HybD family hydrogenase maturation endopeptidase [Sulfurimonas autotrophica]|uniref:Hydrogenase maturation protease n=1 Tax=Sulfurimonas autotrophica (strain ATCC BAA-671 / DSM 16294 / JCM 11897 / OK10) TaxID=563040 RepID=E0UTJ1_SULAO|nr:HyaD/HybD family hydrogenase maturation endopeptidase [Sulfurimonas autotrophica]ADN09356.1 hydrogenase maturation protease [Sulfurimonas autotrophica DSM 16294]